MRFRSSVAFSLVFALLLTVTAPLAAAPRHVNEPGGWWSPADHVVRMVVKGLIARFLGFSSNGDGMIPPTP